MDIKRIGLTNNQLKILAMVSMLLDHVGLMLLPEWTFLRVLGRLAFPIFAYMIAEGCRHTKNRIKYLLTLLVMALGIQAVYFVAMGSLYQNILLTFTLSVLLICGVDLFLQKKTVARGLLAAGTVLLVVFVGAIAPVLFKSAGFVIDYGFFGVLLPVAVYYAPGNKPGKLIAVAAILLIRALLYGELKWFAFLSLPFLALYNGKRGKYKLKYLFYIFYPAHLLAIYLIEQLLSRG